MNCHISGFTNTYDKFDCTFSLCCLPLIKNRQSSLSFENKLKWSRWRFFGHQGHFRASVLAFFLWSQDYFNERLIVSKYFSFICLIISVTQLISHNYSVLFLKFTKSVSYCKQCDINKNDKLHFVYKQLAS